MKHDKFKRGSGCFTCAVCKRQTRDTGDNGDVGLCPEDYDIAGYENTISDGAYEQIGMTKTEVRDEIARLRNVIASKKGEQQ